MRNLKLIIFVFFLAIILSGCLAKENESLVFSNNRKLEPTQSNEQGEENKYQVSSIDQVVDRLEVYYFHRTQRCVSCLTIGKYAEKTMAEYFSEEIKGGKIDYREINIDLAENKLLARKFQASGSSLFINTIRGEQENIENVMEIWNLKGDETKFKNFLKQKINILLEM